MTEQTLVAVRCTACNFVTGAYQIPYETLLRGDAQPEAVFQAMKEQDNFPQYLKLVREGKTMWEIILTLFNRLDMQNKIAGEAPTVQELENLFPLKREIIHQESKKISAKAKELRRSRMSDIMEKARDTKRPITEIEKETPSVDAMLKALGAEYQFTPRAELDRQQAQNSKIRFFYGAIREGLKPGDAMDAMGIRKECCRKTIFSPIQISGLPLKTQALESELTPDIFVNPSVAQYTKEDFRVEDDETFEDMQKAMSRFKYGTEDPKSLEKKLEEITLDDKEKNIRLPPAPLPKSDEPRYRKKRLVFLT